MPPIREHKSTSPSSQHQQNPSSGEDDIDFSSPKSDKSASASLVDKDRNRRGKRSPSIDTRASRVGVTNFINVIKSLHPGESMSYFPITKETLQEYIDSKRKAFIKAGSLRQYLQHIQAYNIALGFGWDDHVFGPIINKVLDELRAYEDEASLKTGNILVVSLGQSRQPTLINSTISQQLQQSNPFSSSLDYNFITSSSSTDIRMENEDINKFITTNYDDPIYDLSFKAYEDETLKPGNILVASSGQSQQPASVNSIISQQLQQQLQQSNPFSSYLDYNSSSSIDIRMPNNENEDINRFDSPILKSVTIRSKTKVYKQMIAVSDTTTFASLISFAIKVSPPTGKQFVIRAVDGVLEYMPDCLVREVITGVEHTEIIVSIEEVGPPVDFDWF